MAVRPSCPLPCRCIVSRWRQEYPHERVIAVHAVVEARAVVCLRCGVRAWLMASRSVVKRLTVCVAFACWWGHLLTASGCHNDIVGDLNEQETREAAEKYLADHKVVQI